MLDSNLGGGTLIYMKNSYAHNPLSLHPTTSSGRLYGDCNPSTVVLGVKGRRSEEAVGCRASFPRRAPAFTIVELLIVIVVIGILAAISIVAYVGITNSAYNAAVKNDLTNFAKKMEIIKAQTGAYPDGTAFTKDMGFAFSRTSYGPDYQLRNLRYCLNPATDNYIMYARSKSRRYFKYTASSGLSIAEDKFGYEVCSQIGLVTTNPSTNGLYDTTWADWVN